MSQSASTGLVLKQTIAHPDYFFSDLFHPFLLITGINSKLELITFDTADRKQKGSCFMKTEQESCLGTLPNGIQSLPLSADASKFTVSCTHNTLQKGKLQVFWIAMTSAA